MGGQQHDVVIVGAGLAGLTAARILHRFGLDVVVLERAEQVGGRVRTDLVDGFRLDHGFQLYNPAYPAGSRTFDHAALDLQAFGPGVEVVRGGRRLRLVDPRREPGATAATAATVLLGQVAPAWQIAPFAAYAAACAAEPAARLRARADIGIGEALRQWGVGEAFLQRVIVPFLSGVFADVDLVTSRRYADLILRSFLRGTPSVPAAGMQSLPEQIAAELPDGVVRLGVRVGAVADGSVQTSSGEFGGEVTIVATEAPAAAALLPGLRVAPMSALTTWYFAAPAAAAHDARYLLVDGTGAPMLCNVAVVSAVAADYAPAGQALVAASAVGLHPQDATAATARSAAAAMLGVGAAELTEVGRYPIRDALPAFPQGTGLRRSIDAGSGVLVIGDHRDTPSIQGALVSGERGAAAAVRLLGFTRR